MEWISKLLDINKLPTRIILLIWFISAVLLYIPESIIKNLDLVDFKADYGKYFGIAFLTSSCLLMITVGTWVIKKIHIRRLNVKYKNVILESVNNLDTHEIAILREFYIQGRNTLKIPMDNPTVSGLVNKGILHRVGQYGEMSVVGMLFNHAISKIARDNLTSEILELPNGEPSINDIERIQNQRPSWMLTLESKQKLIDGLYNY